MTILNPEHLFEQAVKLSEPRDAGPPRQVDLRRAISAAYYGVFHAVLTEAADVFVGVTKRSTQQYALVYRSIDHRGIRDICQEAKKSKLGARYFRYAPGGFSTEIQAFAAGFVELQEKRHNADYDPSIKFKMSDAVLAVDSARTTLARLRRTEVEERRLFLSLLLFSPR